MGLAQANGYMKLGGVNKPIEGRASGLTVGDYRRAEGVSFFACDVKGKGVKDVEGQFIAELVTPGDARGTLPEVRVVKDSVDAEGYRVVDTRYESTTVSGYTVFRRGRTRATVLSDGKLYALTASCSENRWKKAGEMLGKSLDSFSVFRV